MSDRSASLFRSVDVAVFAGALLVRLRAAGVTVGPTAANRLAAAMACCPPSDVSTLYWVARTTLINDRRDFAVFDELFDAVFGGLGLPIAPWERDTPRATVTTEGSVLRHSGPTDGLAAIAARITRARPDIVDTDPDDDTDTDDTDDNVLPELLPSPLAELADRPFDQLSPEQLRVVGEWLEQTMTEALRISRRRERARLGSIDFRRTMRSARSSGEIVKLVRHRQRLQPRPVVMLADVSGSMESFTRIYLHLMRALMRAPGGGAEVFPFATSLRRVTVQLRDRDPQAAIDRLSDEVADRFSGTRIAASIGQLLSSPRWSNAVRGATVVIASDGWDTDPPTELAKRMARLQRLSYRVIWVNPRSAAVGYEPVVAGMATALPYVDELLSGHSLLAMHDVIAAIARGQLLSPGRRGSSPAA